MKKTDWKSIAEFIGIAAIVASLIFVGIQVKQSQSSANVGQLASYGEMMLEMRLSLVEHADVWQRACADEDLTPAESVKAAQLFRAYMESTYTQGITADLGMFDYGPLLADRLAANIHRYPGFKRMFEALSDWTRLGEPPDTIEQITEFGEMIRARIEELQKLEANPNFDIAMCGM